MMNSNHNNNGSVGSAEKVCTVQPCTLSNLRTWKHISPKPPTTPPNYWYQSSYPVAAAAPGKVAKKPKQSNSENGSHDAPPQPQSTPSPTTPDSNGAQHIQHVGHGGSLKAVLLLGGLRELFGGMHDDLGTVLQTGGISDEMIDQLKDVSTAIGLVVEELNNCRTPCCELHGATGEKCSCK